MFLKAAFEKSNMYINFKQVKYGIRSTADVKDSNVLACTPKQSSNNSSVRF